MDLNLEERLRYNRHLILPEFGDRGQIALRRATVAVVGLGGLGSASAPYLAAAGVGRLILVDSDVVDASNLQRQLLYSETDIGRDKLDCAERRLAAINSGVAIEKRRARLTADNAREILEPCDVAVDGTDNLAARYCLNEACAALGKPLVYAAVRHWEGQVSIFDARQGPCYRCLYPDPPPADELAKSGADGILGALPGAAGALQAAECVKLIASVGDPLIGRLLLFDTLTMRFREIPIPRDPSCPVCGAVERR